MESKGTEHSPEGLRSVASCRIAIESRWDLKGGNLHPCILFAPKGAARYLFTTEYAPWSATVHLAVIGMWGGGGGWYCQGALYNP